MTQVSFSDQNLSVVRRCRRCSIHLHLLLQKHMTKFNQNLHKASLNSWWKGIKVYSKDGRNRFPRGDNNKLKKIHWKTLKVFSRTTGPISTKPSSKYLCVKSIWFCSKEGPRLFSRKDNQEISKNTLTNFKNLPRPLAQFQQKAAESILQWRGFEFVQKKGHILFQGR